MHTDTHIPSAAGRGARRRMKPAYGSAKDTDRVVCVCVCVCVHDHRVYVCMYVCMCVCVCVCDFLGTKCRTTPLTSRHALPNTRTNLANTATLQVVPMAREGVEEDAITRFTRLWTVRSALHLDTRWQVTLDRSHLTGVNEE